MIDSLPRHRRRTVVVTDGDQRAALALVRSLSASGFRCVVTSSVRRSIAGVSRHAAREVLLPDALEAPATFVNDLAELARAESATLVVPISEPSMLAVLPERARFAPAIIPFADAATFAAVSDKRRLLQAAEALGIATPRQVVVADADAASAFDVDQIAFPCVLKPARSVGEHAGQRSKLGVSYAGDASELRRRLNDCHPSAFPLLLQQRIVGSGTGVFLLRWDGELRASFAHRRLWEKPPSGGVSVYCESTALDETLLEQSCRLLERFDWRGVAMVEYKRESATGTPYLMEVNGRFWGSLQLAIDAGVDFPSMLADAALEMPARTMGPFRVGVRSRWWWGQVDHLLARIRRPDIEKWLPPGTPGMASTLTQLFLAPLRAAGREEVFRWSDPRPFWYETMRWFRGR